MKISMENLLSRYKQAEILGNLFSDNTKEESQSHITNLH